MPVQSKAGIQLDVSKFSTIAAIGLDMEMAHMIRDTTVNFNSNPVTVLCFINAQALALALKESIFLAKVQQTSLQFIQSHHH